MGRLIGLTGGIGSGKSTVARILRELGATVVDADQVARDVVRPGAPAYEAIVREFGREVLDAGGEIDRKKLGERVFSDPAARLKLEGITHPQIGLETARRTTEAFARGEEVVIYEAPLIVEKDLHLGMQGLIVVVATEAAQIARVIARDRLTEDEAKRRMAAQLPTEKKVAVADYLIQNDGPVEKTREQVERAWRDIVAGGPR